MVLEWLKSKKKIILIIIAYFVILTIVAVVISVVITLLQKEPEKVIDEALFKLIGNGYCDDTTNTNAFEYDGGDCCINPIQIGDCQLCQCHKDGLVYTTTLATTTVTEVFDTTSLVPISSTTLMVSFTIIEVQNVGPCPYDFIETEKFCLQIQEKVQSYTSAIFACTNGFLFEPQNITMEMEMNELIPTDIQYWIGMTYSYDKHVLKYTTSALPVNYINFHDGIEERNPDPYGQDQEKDCVIMAYMNETWAWLPDYCVNPTKNHVVCVTNKNDDYLLFK